MIVIVDYDIGNVSAVANMLARVGAKCEITSSPTIISQASKIILPGNGSFDACMKNLRASGLIPILEEKVLTQKIPLLGICVGAQMLGNTSEEGTEAGLGWLDIRVRRFPSMPGFRIPHMGWNEVFSSNSDSAKLHGVEAGARFYFVHSYYMDPADSSDVLLSAKYGIEFAAAVSRQNITGLQFHPEKSHRFGRRIFEAFVRGE